MRVRTSWMFAFLAASATGAGWRMAVVPELPPPAVPMMPVIETVQKISKPIRITQTPVIRVRLFTNRTVKSVVFESPVQLSIESQLVKAPATVYLDKGKLLVRSGRRIRKLGTATTVRPINHTRLALRPNDRNLVIAPGAVTLTADGKGIEVVNRVDLESYLLGVVGPELGSFDLPMEALKAQIVASRSYVLGTIDQHRGENYEFCDTAHCQVYRGMSVLPPRVRKAAQDVEGVYLEYRGRPATGFFHHSCGGMTASIEDVWPVSPVPYLTRVKDPDNEILGQRPVGWIFTADRRTLANCFRRARWLAPYKAISDLRVIRRNGCGRAQQVLIQTDVPKWIPADRFRQIVNSFYGREVLLSNVYSVRLMGRQVRFEGRGWGHGVGLCQAGAVTLARQGQNHKQLLSHYYPGTTLAQIKPSTRRTDKPTKR